MLGVFISFGYAFIECKELWCSRSFGSIYSSKPVPRSEDIVEINGAETR